MRLRRRGLTMIELMVTVAVVAVLAAVAYPNMTEFIDRQRLVAQTLAISELAQTARSEAIKRSAAGPSDQKSVAMSINAGSSWSIGLANGTAACTDKVSCWINQGGEKVFYFLDSTNLDQAQCKGCTMVSPTASAVMVFDFRGVVTGGADQQITLQSPKGKQLGVRVSPLGRITVCVPSGTVTGYPAC